jgi:hypothetical protein
MPLTRVLRLASVQPSLIISAEPPLVLSSPRHDEPPTVSPPSRTQLLHVPGADADADVGDRSYLVLAKPNVIMNDLRLRGLAVAGSDAAGRKSPDNHAQTVRNIKRILRNAAAGARLIQVEGLDRKSAADVTDSLANALDELHRLRRSLDRRTRRDRLGYDRGMKSREGGR